MAFSSRFRFRNLPRFLTGALGDMWYRATNGDLTAVRGTKATGRAAVIQSDGGLTWTDVAGASAGNVSAARQAFDDARTQTGSTSSALDTQQAAYAAQFFGG